MSVEEVVKPTVCAPEDAAKAKRMWEFHSSLWNQLCESNFEDTTYDPVYLMVNINFILEKSLELGFVARGEITPGGEFIEVGSLVEAVPNILSYIASLPTKKW